MKQLPPGFLSTPSIDFIAPQSTSQTTIATMKSRQGYEPIGEEQPLELGGRDGGGGGSSSDDDNTTSNNTSKKSTLMMGVSALVLVTLAFLVGRTTNSSSGSSSSKGGGGKKTATLPNLSNMPTRLCEIYQGGNIQMIQTSFAEPSKQWSEVPCVHVDNRKLNKKEENEDDEQQKYGTAEIKIDFNNIIFPNRPPILGFGGAFTEAAALNFNSLSKDGQETVIELLFGKSGLGYTMGRTHINSCDFCVQSYSFDDTEDDFMLEDFDTEVTHDLESGMVDMMLLAQHMNIESFPREADEYGMRIIASPWSPPAWMKAPTEDDVEGAVHAENMTSSAFPVCLRDGVGKQSKYAASWALFFDKFITAYANHGVKFYGVTVQNEPEFAAPWDACAYDIHNEGDFIANHLGPQLKKSHPDVKLLIFDHNKDHIVKWAKKLLTKEHPASKYIDGTAVHWYAGGMDRLLDGAQGNPNMHRFVSELEVVDVRKDHVLLGSEACHCPTTGYAGGDLSIAWARAMRNVHTILADLAAGSNGFIEWNLILDSIGGPNHLGNLCDSPVLAVPHRALDAEENFPSQLEFEHAGHPFGEVHGDNKTREELNAEGSPASYLDLGIVVQPMFYYVGHITRFVRPGSRAVQGLVDASAGDPKVRTFRPKGQVVAGGGINDLARDGIEVTLWPCEGSTRQEWLLNDDKQLQVFGHDWLGAPTTSCLAKRPDKDFEGLLLTSCNITENKSGSYEVLPVEGKEGKVHLMSSTDKKGNCLVVQPLRNNGGAYGPRGGAQVNVGSCDHPWAEWGFDSSTGEITSSAFEQLGEVCLTTGWPFLQVGAFDTSATAANNGAVVITNEAGEHANYELKSRDETMLAASIPPRSIQTITFN